MNEAINNRILVTGATGKTGSRVAEKLASRGAAVRRAARSGADVRFDWSDLATFGPTLTGVTAVYLISPALRVDFAGIVSRFLDEAEQAGVRHVTYLSAYGVEHAPPEVALRAVELDLASRKALSHSILRPAWFMQNFSENFLRPVNDEIVVPCGTGAEAFVSAEDIASVASATLLHPARHAGRAYAPTGPEALTFEQAARGISTAAARTITYRDIDRELWINAMIQAGVPAEYGAVLRSLTETVAAGRGSRPNEDVLVATGTSPTRFEDFAGKTAAHGDRSLYLDYLSAPENNVPNARTTRKQQMSNKSYAIYKPVRPYFDLVRGALGDLVDGEHFFDCVADDIAYEVLYNFPGWPRVIQGRADLMESFRGYGKHIELHAADRLIKHSTDNGQFIVIEYEVHGTILATGVEYNNRFCSIIKIESRRIAHWRDYMDSLAAWNALTPTSG